MSQIQSANDQHETKIIVPCLERLPANEKQEHSMLVTLMGPTESGAWVLADHNGNNFSLVQRYEDHPEAASLFGWQAPAGVTDEEEIIQDALDWLMDHINEDIEAPKDVAEYFEESQRKDES